MTPYQSYNEALKDVHHLQPSRFMSNEAGRIALQSVGVFKLKSPDQETKRAFIEAYNQAEADIRNRSECIADATLKELKEMFK